MRIGLKLTLVLLVPTVLLSALIGAAYQRRSRDLLRAELAREGRAIARVLQIASEDFLLDRELGDLRQLADQVAGYERVLGVRVFDTRGQVLYQPDALRDYPFRSWSELRRAIGEDRTVQLRRLFGKESVIGFIVPLHGRDGKILGAMQVLQLESYVLEDARVTRDFVVMLTLGMLVASLVAILLVTHFSITQPIDRLVRQFREVGAGELPAQEPAAGPDELAILSTEFGRMRERLERSNQALAREQEHRRKVEQQLRVSERLASLGRLSAGLAHEIGTPLNVIIGRAESQRRTTPDPESVQRNLGIIVTQGERIARIVRDMLDFARMKPARRVETDALAALRSVLALTDRQCESCGVRVEPHWGVDSAVLVADADQLQQVFLNLVVNATDAMPDGGLLRVKANVEAALRPGESGAPRRCLTVTFEDNGHGIPAEDLERVFDPFFTTKAPGRGTGLGLSVSYGIIEEHGGWFDIQSEPGVGTRVTVLLPFPDDVGGSGPERA